MAESKNVGLFLVLPAPLNPIGAFDAETFKARFRDVMEECADAKFIGVDLSGIDFVYSDAYNAFMQFHQELSKRNGTFAVLADRESLAKSLKKVGLERFIRIFMSEADMAAYAPVEQMAVASAAPATPAAEEPAKPIAAEPEKPVAAEPEKPADVATETAPASPVSQAPVAPKIMDTNPLVDETQSSKGSLVAVIVLLIIVIAIVAYLIL